MAHQFTGFPKELFIFLNNLSNNNRREWFHENKPYYKQHIVEPMQDFIVAIAPALKDISKHYVADPRTNGGSMFRIYRDTRFSKDKTPYKEHVACQFRHAVGKDAHAPGFYIHIQPNRVRVGGGIWTPHSPALFKVRTRIAEKPKEWESIISDKQFIQYFGGINGDSLKRAPKGFDPHHPQIDYLKKKSFFAMQDIQDNALLKKSFLKTVEKNFNALSPFMKFITKSLDLPY